VTSPVNPVGALLIGLVDLPSTGRV